MTIQDAPVRRPILAVRDANKAGNFVGFDRDIAAIIARDSREGKQIVRLMKRAKRKITLEERDGVFVMPAWVIPPNKERSAPVAPFQGPGPKK